jgi:hypothetical protein
MMVTPQHCSFNKGRWTKQETAALFETLRSLSVPFRRPPGLRIQWSVVAERLGSRTPAQCRNRYLYFLRQHQQSDVSLRESWQKKPVSTGCRPRILQSSSIAVQERLLNRNALGISSSLQLNVGHHHENDSSLHVSVWKTRWSKREVEILLNKLDAYAQIPYGRRWTCIAQHLPDRTADQCRFKYLDLVGRFGPLQLDKPELYHRPKRISWSFWELGRFIDALLDPQVAPIVDNLDRVCTSAFSMNKPIDAAFPMYKSNDTAFSMYKPNDAAFSAYKPKDTAFSIKNLNDNAFLVNKSNAATFSMDKPNDTAFFKPTHVTLSSTVPYKVMKELSSKSQGDNRILPNTDAIMHDDSTIKDKSQNEPFTNKSHMPTLNEFVTSPIWLPEWESIAQKTQTKTIFQCQAKFHHLIYKCRKLGRGFTFQELVRFYQAIDMQYQVSDGSRRKKQVPRSAVPASPSMIDWRHVARHVQTRSPMQCWQLFHYLVRIRMRHEPWSSQELEILKDETMQQRRDNPKQRIHWGSVVKRLPHRSKQQCLAKYHGLAQAAGKKKEPVDAIAFVVKSIHDQ